MSNSKVIFTYLPKYHWKRQLTKHKARTGFRHSPNTESSKGTDQIRPSKPLAVNTHIHHLTLATRSETEVSIPRPFPFLLRQRVCEDCTKKEIQFTIKNSRDDCIHTLLQMTKRTAKRKFRSMWNSHRIKTVIISRNLCDISQQPKKIFSFPTSKIWMIKLT